VSSRRTGLGRGKPVSVNRKIRVPDGRKAGPLRQAQGRPSARPPRRTRKQRRQTGVRTPLSLPAWSGRIWRFRRKDLSCYSPASWSTC